jgi:hypothetical protein
MEAAPATLLRAARDFSQKEPAFAAQVAVYAVSQLLADRGYDAIPLDIDEAVGYLMAAADKIGQRSWAIAQLSHLVRGNHRDDLMAKRLVLKLAELEASDSKTRH